MLFISQVAGGERKHLASMAAQLGVGHRALSADDLAANLLVAAEGGVVEEVESLLAAGANVDAADRMVGEIKATRGTKAISSLRPLQAVLHLPRTSALQL